MQPSHNTTQWLRPCSCVCVHVRVLCSWPYLYLSSLFLCISISKLAFSLYIYILARFFFVYLHLSSLFLCISISKLAFSTFFFVYPCLCLLRCLTSPGSTHLYWWHAVRQHLAVALQSKSTKQSETNCLWQLWSDSSTMGHRPFLERTKKENNTRISHSTVAGEK